MLPSRWVNRKMEVDPSRQGGQEDAVPMQPVQAQMQQMALQPGIVPNGPQNDSEQAQAQTASQPAVPAAAVDAQATLPAAPAADAQQYGDTVMADQQATTAAAAAEVPAAGPSAPAETAAGVPAATNGPTGDASKATTAQPMTPLLLQLPEFVDNIGFALTPIDLNTGEPVGPSQLLNTAAIAALQLLAGGTHTALHGRLASKVRHGTARPVRCCL